MKLVLLDRDGVINFNSDVYIKSPQEWQPIPGSLNAIARLKKADYTIMVATNQSGLARGLYDENTLNDIHKKMQDMLTLEGGSIDRIVYCPHGPNEGCECRKPQPGLLLKIAKELRINLQGVPMIGDSLRDIQAALKVGANPMLVRTGYGIRTLNSGELPADIPVFENLAAAADFLLEIN